MAAREIRSCLVTGGTGFIGSHLVDLLLEKGVKVRCLVRDPSRLGWLEGKPVSVVHGDLFSTEALISGVSGVDAVFHLAGVLAAKSRAEYFRVNAQGCLEVARAVMAVPERPSVMVYLSSQAAVGPSARGQAVDEKTPPVPLTDYGRSKLEGERLLESLPDLPFVILRPPTVYGPRDREVFTYFRLASMGFIPQASRDAVLSMVHVADLVKGIYQAAAAGELRGRYFLTAEPPLSAGELPSMVGAALGRRVRVISFPYWVMWLAAAAAETVGRLTGTVPVFNRQKVRELKTPGWACTAARAAAHFGFFPEIRHQDGFRDTVLWYRQRGWLK